MAIDIQLYLTSDLRTIAHPSPSSNFTNSGLWNTGGNKDKKIKIRINKKENNFKLTNICEIKIIAYSHEIIHVQNDTKEHQILGLSQAEKVCKRFLHLKPLLPCIHIILSGGDGLLILFITYACPYKSLHTIYILSPECGTDLHKCF